MTDHSFYLYQFQDSCMCKKWTTRNKSATPVALGYQAIVLSFFFIEDVLRTLVISVVGEIKNDGRFVLQKHTRLFHQDFEK